MTKCFSIFLLIYISMAYADPVANNDTDEDKKQLKEKAQAYVKNSRPDYECEGISIFDAGATMDMPIYFAETNSRKFLCSWSIGGTVFKNSKPNQKCPPVEWITSGCAIKHQEFKRNEREMLINKTGEK